MTALDGRVALVTGGARGLGEAYVRALHAEGAHVVIADVQDDPGAHLASDLGDRALFAHLDVTAEDEWARVVDAATRAFGRIDVLVNNAGIANAAPIEHFTTAKWDAVIAVNLTGVFFGCRAVVPVMKAQGGGSIINISSVEGLRGSPGLHGYTASKFGVSGLTNKAETLRKQTGNPRGHCIAAAAVEIINSGRGGKKLASWWRNENLDRRSA